MAGISKRRNGMYYRDENRIYPSVTTILSVISKPALIFWAAKMAARTALANPTLSEEEASSIIYQKKNDGAARGSAVHTFCEMYQRWHKIKVEDIPVELRGYANAFISWSDSFKPEIISLEKTVFSDEHQFAGTLDMIVKDASGFTWLIDIKTSKDYYPEMGLQLSAYKVGVEELDNIKIDKTAVLLLGEEGTFKLVETNAPFTAFLATKELWKYFNQDRIEGAKPKKSKKERENEK